MSNEIQSNEIQPREIHFYIDVKEETIPDNILSDVHISYTGTGKAIRNKQRIIHTMDISHLSFGLIDKGYDIYVHCNGRTLKMYPGMDSAGGKDIRHAHDIRKMLVRGYFNTDFDYNFNTYD